MAISYAAMDISFPKIKRRETSTWIKKIIGIHHKKAGNIAYCFCSDDEILKINQQHLNHDYYTDIITFDYSENDTISGDLLISVETVESNAKEFGVKYCTELNRVMIHGILHLCGFNDKTQEEERQMRAKEDEALALINDKNEV